MSLSELIDEFAQRTANDLRNLAYMLGQKNLPSRQADLAHLVACQLHGEALAQTIARMTDIERLALADAVHNQGYIDPVRVQSRYGVTLRPAERDRRHPGVDRTGNDGYRLLVCVLVDDTREVIPALIEPLKALLTAPQRPPLRCHDGDPPAEAGMRLIPTATIALREFHGVLRLAETGALRCTDSGFPAMTSQRAVQAILAEPDVYAGVADQTGRGVSSQEIGPIRPVAWPTLMYACNYSPMTARERQLTTEGAAAMAMPAHRALKDCCERWGKASDVDEFRRIDAIKGQGGRGGDCFSNPAKRRATILDQLRLVPPGRWVSFTDLGRWMRGADERLKVCDSTPWELYLREKRYGNLGFNGSHGWDILEMRYLAVVLMEYLATLGVVDLALIPPWGAASDYRSLWGADDLPYLSRYDGLRAIRVTELGAFILGVSDTFTAPPAPPSSLRVQGDGSVLATGAIPVSDRILLDSWLLAESERAWRIDRARLLRACEEGRSLDDLRGFLTQAGPLPDAVSRLMDDAQRRFTAITDAGSWRAFQLPEELAQMVLGDPRTARFLRRLDKDLIAVRNADWKAVRKAIRALGWSCPE
jgi:hypothetical protein